MNRCWLCGSLLPAPASAAGDVAAPPPALPKADLANAARTFQLSSLMLVITLIAVCLGLFRLVPWLGIVAVVLATPALIRTMIFSKRRRAAGVALTIPEKFVAFVGSVAVAMTICLGTGVALGVAGFLALYIACSDIIPMSPVAGYREVVMGLLVGIPILLGLVVGGLLARWLWPKLR